MIFALTVFAVGYHSIPSLRAPDEPTDPAGNPAPLPTEYVERVRAHNVGKRDEEIEKEAGIIESEVVIAGVLHLCILAFFLGSLIQSWLTELILCSPGSNNVPSGHGHARIAFGARPSAHGLLSCTTLALWMLGGTLFK